MSFSYRELSDGEAKKLESHFSLISGEGGCDLGPLWVEVQSDVL